MATATRKRQRTTTYTVWYRLQGGKWQADRPVRQITDLVEAREAAQFHARHPLVAEVQITGKDDETCVQVYAAVVK